MASEFFIQGNGEIKRPGEPGLFLKRVLRATRSVHTAHAAVSARHGLELLAGTALSAFLRALFPHRKKTFRKFRDQSFAGQHQLRERASDLIPGLNRISCLHEAAGLVCGSCNRESVVWGIHTRDRNSRAGIRSSRRPYRGDKNKYRLGTRTLLGNCLSRGGRDKSDIFWNSNRSGRKEGKGGGQ